MLTLWRCNFFYNIKYDFRGHSRSQIMKCHWTLWKNKVWPIQRRHLPCFDLNLRSYGQLFVLVFLNLQIKTPLNCHFCLIWNFTLFNITRRAFYKNSILFTVLYGWKVLTSKYRNKLNVDSFLFPQICSNY